ncbi:hypothetical protein, partial [Parasphingorhabdus sp.]|uniref:hypothetical protein n=1 Tax=Parasphingorhabdus sp. TaxID=2709688 RepID=UPI0032EE05E0
QPYPPDRNHEGGDTNAPKPSPTSKTTVGDRARNKRKITGWENQLDNSLLTAQNCCALSVIANLNYGNRSNNPQIDHRKTAVLHPS